MLGVGGHLRIGELLIDVGILNQEKVSKAVTIAQKRSLPVGRALVMSGLLSEQVLQAALQAQSLYRDGLINHDESVKAMAMVSDQGITLDEALSLLRWVRDKKVVTNRLGELLVEADILSEAELEGYLDRSKDSGLPLGRFLSSIGVVPESLIMAALNMQMLIREGKVERDAAIRALGEARSRQFSLDRLAKDVSANDFPSSLSVRLGELLIKARIIKADQLMIAVENALLQNKQLGQVLVSSNIISKEELDSALMLQDMVANGSLKPSRAAEAMARLHTNALSLSEAITQASAMEIENGETITLSTFLGLAGVVTSQDIIEYGNIENSTLFGKQLVAAGKVSEFFLRDCQRIHTLIVEGMVTLERAIVILKHCQSTGRSVKVSLVDFGWKMPS
jgi:hypothetical protein